MVKITAATTAAIMITAMTIISKMENDEGVVTFVRLCIGSLLTEDDEIAILAL